MVLEQRQLGKDAAGGVWCAQVDSKGTGFTHNIFIIFPFLFLQKDEKHMRICQPAASLDCSLAVDSGSKQIARKRLQRTGSQHSLPCIEMCLPHWAQTGNVKNRDCQCRANELLLLSSSSPLLLYCSPNLFQTRIAACNQRCCFHWSYVAADLTPMQGQRQYCSLSRLRR